MMDGIISIEFYNDLSSIIESSRKSAYQMVDRILVIRNWLLGKRIAEKEYQALMLTDMVKRLFLNWHGHSQSSTGSFPKGQHHSNLP